MISHIQEVWSRYGEEDPYWSVITSEEFRGNNLQNLGVFYSTGQGGLDQLRLFFKRNHIDLTKKLKCLEYGCGVGRTTGWLAQTFRQVIAYDISAGHIKVARE